MYLHLAGLLSVMNQKNTCLKEERNVQNGNLHISILIIISSLFLLLIVFLSSTTYKFLPKVKYFWKAISEKSQFQKRTVKPKAKRKLHFLLNWIFANAMLFFYQKIQIYRHALNFHDFANTMLLLFIVTFKYAWTH